MIAPLEFSSAEQIRTFQERKLAEQLHYLNVHSPFYKRLLEKHGIHAGEIQKLDDLLKLPLTSKDDLQLFNDDFICVPKNEIIDVSSTSGTVGKPINFILNDADLDRLAYNEALSFSCAGVKSGDLVQLMTTMDRRFMAGLAYFLGLRKLGAGVIRTGTGVPDFQLDSILVNKPKFLIAVPSFLLKLAKHAEEQGIDLNATSPVAAICIGEPLRNQDFTPLTLCERIQERWNIELISTYASTEMSTAFTECEALQGGHEHSELIITEILDDRGHPVEAGQLGELTITTLGVRGMPLLRYKTGDIVRKHEGICGCGRHSARIGPVAGRKKQMIKYKGTTLFPIAIQDVLNSFNEIFGHIVEISTNDIGTDDVNVKISSTDFSDNFLHAVKEKMRSKIRVVPQISCISEDELNRLVMPTGSRKPKVVIDLR
jgi:phenylacetate-CoA ligase